MNLVWSFTEEVVGPREIDTQFVPSDRDEDNLVIPVGVPLFPSSGQENLQG